MNKAAMQESETWVAIPGYDGIYEVSCQGRVKSVRSGRILSYSKRCGYFQLTLSRHGKVKNFTVHRLVALAFHPNPDNKPQVNHKNAIKTDNRATNLEWVTEKENVHHAIKLGLFNLSIGSKMLGIPMSQEWRTKLLISNIGRRKSTEEGRKISIGQGVKFRCIEDDLTFDSIVDLAKHYRISRQTFYVKTKSGIPINGKTFELVKGKNGSVLEQYLKTA